MNNFVPLLYHVRCIWTIVSEININVLAYLFTRMHPEKKNLTQKPLHRYRRVLALLSRPKVLWMYSIGAKHQTIKK